MPSPTHIYICAYGKIHRIRNESTSIDGEKRKTTDGNSLYSFTHRPEYSRGIVRHLLLRVFFGSQPLRTTDSAALIDEEWLIIWLSQGQKKAKREREREREREKGEISSGYKIIHVNIRLWNLLSWVTHSIGWSANLGICASQQRNTVCTREKSGFGIENGKRES